MAIRQAIGTAKAAPRACTASLMASISVSRYATIVLRPCCEGAIWSTVAEAILVLPRRIMISALLLAALGTAAGSFLVGYGYYYWHLNSFHYESAREIAVLSQAAEIDHPVTLMLGDSITEFAYLPSVCDGAIFNGGVGGATLAIISDLAPRIMKVIRPSAIIIAIGTNDANRRVKTAPDAFALQYKALIDETRATGAKVYAAKIPPIARKGESFFDPTRYLETQPDHRKCRQGDQHLTY